MKGTKGYHSQTVGLIKDSFIIILLFVSFYFIDVSVAFFITVTCTAILLIRRIILDYNSGAIKNSHIDSNEKELIVPKGVSVFDLRNVPSMEYLYKFIKVMRVSSSPPNILIVRFGGIMQIKKYELDVLKEALHRLKKSKITVILSDVEENVRHQFGECEIGNEVGMDHVFYTIDDALTQADKGLKEAK